ncbi:hypothetical protein GCM10020331_013470 [Ectobacillus funiculus]
MHVAPGVATAKKLHHLQAKSQKQEQVDVSTLTGSGLNGKVLKQDVTAAVQGKRQESSGTFGFSRETRKKQHLQLLQRNEEKNCRYAKKLFLTVCLKVPLRHRM